MSGRPQVAAQSACLRLHSSRCRRPYAWRTRSSRHQAAQRHALTSQALRKRWPQGIRPLPLKSLIGPFRRTRILLKLTFCWDSPSFRAARRQNQSNITNERLSCSLVPTRVTTTWLWPTCGNVIFRMRAQNLSKQCLDARQADAAYDLGIVLLELGEASAALTQLRHARALKPRPDVDFNIVR